MGRYLIVEPLGTEYELVIIMMCLLPPNISCCCDALVGERNVASSPVGAAALGEGYPTTTTTLGSKMAIPRTFSNLDLTSDPRIAPNRFLLYG